VTRPVVSQDTPSHGLGEQGSPEVSQPSALSALNAFATARIASASDDDVCAAVPAASTRSRSTGAKQGPAPRQLRRPVEAVGYSITLERDGEGGRERRERNRSKFSMVRF
jgi:hypothetical protein